MASSQGAASRRPRYTRDPFSSASPQTDESVSVGPAWPQNAFVRMIPGPPSGQAIELHHVPQVMSWDAKGSVSQERLVPYQDELRRVAGPLAAGEVGLSLQLDARFAAADLYSGRDLDNLLDPVADLSQLVDGHPPLACPFASGERQLEVLAAFVVIASAPRRTAWRRPASSTRPPGAHRDRLPMPARRPGWTCPSRPASPEVPARGPCRG